MSHDTVATILWTLIGVALVLTVFGFAARSWKLLVVAAALTVPLGVLAIFSIGLELLLIAIVQITGAIALHHERQPH